LADGKPNRFAGVGRWKTGPFHRCRLMESRTGSPVSVDEKPVRFVGVGR